MDMSKSVKLTISTVFTSVITSVITAVLPVVLLPVTTVVTVALVSHTACAEEIQDEYYARLAKVSPRDAGGFYQLALWCKENDLSKEARKALERTIRIDPDHAAARKALGYRRYGLGWRLAKDIPKPGKKGSGRTSDVARGGDRERTKPSGGSAGESSDGSSGDDGESTETTTAEADVRDLSAEERLAKKRAWAVEAAKKSGLELNTSEDRRGYLIHSTLKTNSKEFKELEDRFREVRKNIIKAIGLRSKADLWPHKIQIVFLRKLECVRFSDAVLDRPFPQNARWDEIDDYRFLMTKISDLDLTRFMAKTALRFKDGKERWVPSWIEAGVAHAAAALTEEGQDRGMHQQAYLTVLSQLENTPDRSPLMEMLQLTDVRRRNLDRNRKVSLTFLEFLKTARRRRFLKFVDEATEGLRPPEDTRSKEFQDFYIDYFQRQEKLFKSVYRMDLSELDEKWQAFVFDRSKKFDEGEKKEARPRNSRRPR